MPCNTISTQTFSSALTKADQSILVTALEKAGYRITHNIPGSLKASDTNGTVSWTQGLGVTVSAYRYVSKDSVVKAIQQGYSKAAVEWAAKRAGWSVTQQTETKYLVTRR